MKIVIAKYGFSLITGKHSETPVFFVEFINYTYRTSEDLSEAKTYDDEDDPVFVYDMSVLESLAPSTSYLRIFPSIDLAEELLLL